GGAQQQQRSKARHTRAAPPVFNHSLPPELLGELSKGDAQDRSIGRPIPDRSCLSTFRQPEAWARPVAPLEALREGGDTLAYIDIRLQQESGGRHDTVRQRPNEVEIAEERSLV